MGGPFFLTCSVEWWHLFPLWNNPWFLLQLQRPQQILKCCNLYVLGHLSVPAYIFSLYFLRRNILQKNCVLVVQSNIIHRCQRVKSYLKREIGKLHLDEFPCSVVCCSGLQAVCHVRIMRRWSSNLGQWTIQRPRLWVPSPYSLSPTRRIKPAFQW